jgi:hypothetical protein
MMAVYNGSRVKTDGPPSREHEEQRAEDEKKGLGAGGTPCWFSNRTREQIKDSS